MLDSDYEHKEMIYLQDFIDNNKTYDDKIYKGMYWSQVLFVRDILSQVLIDSVDDYVELYDRITLVIGEHVSKSIRLPVYKIDMRKELGVEFIMRGNFHDWKVTVKSNKDIECDFGNLFNTEEEIDVIYCEGMKEEDVCGSYKDNKREFTVQLRNEYDLYTFVWLIKNSLKN